MILDPSSPTNRAGLESFLWQAESFWCLCWWTVGHSLWSVKRWPRITAGPALLVASQEGQRLLSEGHSSVSSVNPEAQVLLLSRSLIPPLCQESQPEPQVSSHSPGLPSLPGVAWEGYGQSSWGHGLPLASQLATSAPALGADPHVLGAVSQPLPPAPPLSLDSPSLPWALVRESTHMAGEVSRVWNGLIALWWTELPLTGTLTLLLPVILKYHGMEDFLGLVSRSHVGWAGFSEPLQSARGKSCLYLRTKLSFIWSWVWHPVWVVEATELARTNVVGVCVLF